VRDFQSKVLQEEWNKFGISVLHRRNERLQMVQEKMAENQQRRSVQAAERQLRMQSMDAALDGMRAKFADQATALSYDAEQLLQKFGAQQQQTTTTTAKTGGATTADKDSKPLPCLGQRAHWMDCQKKYAADSRPCNPYVQALEECVQRTIRHGKAAA
jgi:exonuclease VII large subunit